jgi:hypothetical protein
MSAPGLQPCPFCKSTSCEVLAVEIDLYAGMCRACGAHGPVRVLGPMQLVECVKAMAAHDWNQAIILNAHYDPNQWSDTEYTEGPAAASPVEGQAVQEPGEAVSTAAPGTLNSPEGASVEQRSNKAAGEPHEDRKPDNGGEAVTYTSPPPGPSTDPAAICTRQPDSPQGDESEAPAGGGAEGSQATDHQQRVRERLVKFLADIGMKAQAAADKGINFGVHVATVYTVLKGKAVSPKSLEAMEAALTRNERGRKLSGAGQQKSGTKAAKQASEYAESQIQKLQTNFPEPAGVNRAPAPVAPPRHAETP